MPANDPGPVTTQGSDALFARAQRVIPGGVNSPVRAFRGVGGRPFFVARAEGCRITDVDGRTYIDFLGSWGPLILGHAAPMLIEAVGDALRRGTSYGAPTAAEVEMAELISRAIPSMEMSRLYLLEGVRPRRHARRLRGRPPGGGPSPLGASLERGPRSGPPLDLAILVARSRAVGARERLGSRSAPSRGGEAGSLSLR